MAARLLIKQLGMYPPGCYVRLASDEIAVVTQVGAQAQAPIVAALSKLQGEPYTHPLRRDTAKPEHAIVQTVPASTVKVVATVDQLYEQQSLFR